MTIQKRFERALALEKEITKKEKMFRKYKVEMYKELERRFPLIIHGFDTKNSEWKKEEFEDEIQILLKSMLKRDSVVTLIQKDSYNGYENEFYITQRYGLKLPRSRREYSIFPSFNNSDLKEASVKNGIFTIGRDEYRFCDLVGNKNIDQLKLQKFLYFLEKIVELLKPQSKNYEDLRTKAQKFLKNLSPLSEYSALSKFSAYLKAVSRLEPVYKKYSSGLEIFLQEQSKLLNELQEYNKPFKVLMKLKGYDI